MSIHAHGLSEDPFAPPVTLSREETSHLIQRRVFACGGDGAALFPVATCAEIHRLAGGLPDVIWDLAGKSLRAASAEGAPAVLPAHVALAFGTTAQVGGSASRHAAAGAAAVPNPPPPPYDDIPDLPASAAGGIALPSAPSEELATDARDWVSRFIAPSGPGPAPGAGAWSEHAPTIHDATAVSRAAAPGAADRRTPAAPPSSRHHPSRRRRWSATETIVAVATAAVTFVFLAVIGIRQVPRGDSHPAAPAPKPTVPASSPAIGPSPVAPDSVSRTGPRPSVARSRTAPPPAAAPLAATPAVPARGDSSRGEALAPQFGIEVATFIFQDRAEAERARLVASGYRVRVRTRTEAGSVSYRLILGPFASQALAERAADQLLADGTVQQARIITLRPRK